MAKCRQCHGTGTIECTNCDGEGEYTPRGKSEPIPCPKCNSSGEISCPRCGGSGFTN